MTEPYAWVEGSGRALRRSRRLVIGLAVFDVVLFAWYVWSIFHGGVWWWRVLLGFWVGFWLAQAVRSHLRFAATHDRSLLSRERYRMGLPPDGD